MRIFYGIYYHELSLLAYIGGRLIIRCDLEKEKERKEGENRRIQGVYFSLIDMPREYRLNDNAVINRNDRLAIA